MECAVQSNDHVFTELTIFYRKATAMDTPLGRFHWRDHERYGVALCWADDVSMSFPVAYGQPSEEELGLVITSCGMPGWTTS